MKAAKLHVALHGNNTGAKSTRELFLKDSAKFFGFRFQIFCGWCHKWRTIRPPWPTSPGTELKMLDGSISLKFLLEMRLQSKSVDILDDLLGFRVQKLWSEAEVLNWEQIYSLGINFYLSWGKI